jgi:UDP-3-O-[3-hydroxymyristoyl] glucosamine N-acyltransferase
LLYRPKGSYMKLPASMTLSQIAALIGGKVEGPGDLVVSGMSPSPKDATADDIALAFEKKYQKDLDSFTAKALIVPEGAVSKKPLVTVKRPNLAIQKILTALEPKRYHPAVGVHPSAVVDPTAELGENVAVGPLVVIGPKTKIGARTKIMASTVIGGEVTIGEDCLFHPCCMISDFVRIGNRVILQQGAGIGSDGFGYVTERLSNIERRMQGDTELSLESNPHLKIPQIGTVIIEDDVEIGANSTIDRATIGATIIGKGTKIDNQVMVAHNCRVGKEVLLVSQVGIAGSCVIEDRAILAGQVGVKDHITIGRDAILEGKAGVMKDVPAEDVQVGLPAIPVRDYMKYVATRTKMADIYDDVRRLKRQIAELEKRVGDGKPSEVRANGNGS